MFVALIDGFDASEMSVFYLSVAIVGNEAPRFER
jgi:hypothetical protein